MTAKGQEIGSLTGSKNVQQSVIKVGVQRVEINNASRLHTLRLPET